MNIAFAILFVSLLALLGYTAHMAIMRHLTPRPLTRAEAGRLLHARARQLHATRLRAHERSRGESPAIWVPKKWGPLGVRAFRAKDYFEHMTRRALANVGGGFYDHGLKTYYPSDVVAGIVNNPLNPYSNRYMLVENVPVGTTLPTSIAPAYTIGSAEICQIAHGALPPLGIMTDDVGNTANDSGPYSGNVALLGGAGRSTLQGVSDSLINAGTLLIPSRTNNGFLGVVPSIAGVYFCVGLSVNDSEGATTLLEFDQRFFPVSVDEIT